MSASLFMAADKESVMPKFQIIINGYAKGTLEAPSREEANAAAKVLMGDNARAHRYKAQISINARARTAKAEFLERNT